MAFYAHLARQPVPKFGIRSPGRRSPGRNDAPFMGIMAGDAGHFSIRIEGQADSEFFLHLFHYCQTFGRRLNHMIEIAGVISPNQVASLAQHFKTPDKFEIFKGCTFLIWFFHMTEQTPLNDNLSFFIQLVMGVKHHVMSLIMALKTKISSPRIGGSP